MSNMNVRLNESMKIMTIVTCLLAPATVIGGVFGMNLDFGNWIKDNLGFWGVVGIMFLTFGSMIYYFRKKKWF
jgi:magnesium transporter